MLGSTVTIAQTPQAGDPSFASAHRWVEMRIRLPYEHCASILLTLPLSRRYNSLSERTEQVVDWIATVHQILNTTP